MVSSPRRSSRARKPATTIYDEAKEKELERRKSRKDAESDEDEESQNGDS